MFKTILIALSFMITTPVLADQIDIDSRSHTLNYTDAGGATRSYTIGVGRRGTGVHGVFKVERKALNPSWTPTPHMLRGKASYTVAPGPKNPLGVAKLYLSGPRKYIGIHGTNDENSVGGDVSHGCFRMHRADILELYRKIPVGTVVMVH